MKRVDFNSLSPTLKWRIILASHNASSKNKPGLISLDEIIEDLDVTEEIISEEEIERQAEILDKIEEILLKYFNKKERLIFDLVIRQNKKVSEVKEILGYQNWRTTLNNIQRIFKMIKLYYDYEQIDKEKLKNDLEKHFSEFERRVLMLLEERHIIHDIVVMLNKHYNTNKYYYVKLQKFIVTLMEKLESTSDECAKYHYFLKEIRKFKKGNSLRR